VDDHVQINQALAYADNHPGTIVYLKGPFQYVIGSSVLLGWDTKLTGDSSACIKLKNAANWATGTPMIHQIWGDIENTEVYGFEIDGNAANQSQNRGDGYYMMIYLDDAINISVHDMYFHDGLADGFRVQYGEDITYYNNTAKRLGHDASYFEYVDRGEVHHNTTDIQTNSAHRVKDTNNVKIHDNTLKPYALTSTSGNPGIQVEDSTGDTYNIEIYNNVLTDCWGEGIWVIEGGTGNSNQAKNLYIHHNTIRGCGHITTINYNAGITIQGFTGARIESNIIEGCYNASILCINAPLSTGGSIYIRYNLISNTQVTNSSTYAVTNAAWTGTGIVNLQAAKYTMVLSGNTVSGSCGAANYYGVNYANDIIVTTDPKYIPPIQYTPQEIGINYYIEGHSAYINGYPFNWTNKKIDVEKNMGQLKSPGVDGWSLEDFGLEGADITIDCYADSLADMRNAIAAFYQDGRSVLELGGIYTGYQITGYTKNHSTDLRLSQQNFEHNYPYSVLFVADNPIMESVTQRVRGKKITDSGEEWSSDDVFTGNCIKNYSFENWTTSVTNMTWDSRTTPTSPEENEWRSLCWSPTLTLFVAVAQTGTDTRVMTSPDGINWTYQTLTNANRNQQWRCVRWSPDLGMFAAVSITGTGQRVMTSTDGINWTAQNTPADNNWTGLCWGPAHDAVPGRFVAVGVTGTSNRVMTSDDGAVWTIRTSPADLNWVSVCYSPELKLFCAVAYGGGTTLAMTSTDGISWTAQTTPLNQQWVSVIWSPELSLFVAISENGTTQQVMTSPNGTAWTAQDTPATIGWRSVVWSPAEWIFIAVGITGTGTRAMSSGDGIHWTMRNTPASDNNWYAVTWAPTLDMFCAVASSGTANRVMTSTNYGTSTPYMDAAPDDWTLVHTGQERTDDAFVETYALKINGDGVTDYIGEITQPVTFETGLMYVLSAHAKVTGLTHGYLQVDVYAGGMVTKSIIFADDCDYTLKQVTMLFDTQPVDAVVRIFGGGTVNSGASLKIDNVVLQKVNDFEVATVGNDLITLGTRQVVPDYIIEANKLEGGVVSGRTVTDLNTTTTYSSLSTSNVLQKTVTITGKLWKMFRIDQIGWDVMGQSASYNAYCIITIQAPSLYNGAETQISMWGEKTTTYKTCSVFPNITAGLNETVTIKYYIKTENASYRAYIKNTKYIYTEVGSVATISGIKIYNKLDPLTILNAANNIFPGGTIAINADQTGFYKYSENFSDNTYLSVVNSHANDSYNSTSHTVTLLSGGSLVYGFDTGYPVTGIPYMILYVISGSPIISIALDNAGSPGTYYLIDGNDNTNVANTQIYRSLDNITSLRLKGNTIFYVKIAPQSGESCVIGSIYMYAEILTVDAERPKLYPTGSANTMHITMDNDSPLVVSLKYRDAHMVI
jgi:Disaggregatase related